MQKRKNRIVFDTKLNVVIAIRGHFSKPSLFFIVLEKDWQKKYGKINFVVTQSSIIVKIWNFHQLLTLEFSRHYNILVISNV